MVSLGNDSMQRSGGFAFDEWSQSVPDNEDLLEAPSQQRPQVKFQRIHTTWSIIVLVFLMVCLEMALFLVPHFCAVTCGAPPYSLLSYIHAALWFIFMLMDRYWRYQHYNSRTAGYLDFYRKTRHIRRAPILIFSGGTAILLILIVVLNDYCPHVVYAPDRCPGLPLSKCNYIQVVVSLEVAAVLPLLLVYLVKTVRFNRSEPAPDIHQEELIGSFSRSSTLNNGIGFRDETFVDEIVEKQADMIRYLKHHNTHLGRKILQLSAQLDQSSS